MCAFHLVKNTLQMKHGWHWKVLWLPLLITRATFVEGAQTLLMMTQKILLCVTDV